MRQTIDVLPRSIKLQVIPNVYTQDMIQKHFTNLNQTVPVCTNKQAYYTTLQCNETGSVDNEMLKINEMLSQQCYANLNSTLYLNYLDQYLQNCMLNEDLISQEAKNFCAKDIRSSMGLQQTITECFDISFNGKYNLALEPILLSNNLIEYSKKNSQNFSREDVIGPKIFINQALYTHYLDSQIMVQLVCGSYKRKESGCTVNVLRWELICIIVIVC